MSNDSIQKTLTVAFLLCIVCSVIVSTAAVVLKPSQEANKALDQKRNILAAAGMLEEGRSVEEQFAAINTRVVDLRTGRFTDEVDAEKYDQRKAGRDPAASDALSKDEDTASIFRREHYALVYVVEDEQGEIDKIILPIRGAALWGQMYGVCKRARPSATPCRAVRPSDRMGPGSDRFSPTWHRRRVRRSSSSA